MAVISGEAKRVAALDAGADAAVLYDEEWVVRAQKFGSDLWTVLTSGKERGRRTADLVFVDQRKQT